MPKRVLLELLLKAPKERPMSTLHREREGEPIKHGVGSLKVRAKRSISFVSAYRRFADSPVSSATTMTMAHV